MNSRRFTAPAAAAGLFLLFFGLYLRTLCPSVYFGDSGELIAMIHTLGLPHPTGFPLYIMTGKIFELLPLANTAFRINILSAFFGAACVAAIFFVFLVFARNHKGYRGFIVPLLCAVIFGLSYTLWSQSSSARIYTMNGFFCICALYIFLSFTSVRASSGRLFALAFVTGLGSGLHLSFVVFALILWVYLLIKYFPFVKKHLPAILFFAAAGASVYLYIIIRGTSDITLKWQEINSTGSLFDYLRQKQYGSKMFSRPLAGYLHFFGFIRDTVIKEFTLPGFAAVIAGIFAAISSRRRFTVMFLAILLSNILILAVYGNYADLKLAFRYLIPSYIAAVFFIFILGESVYASVKNKKRAGLAVYLLFAAIPVFMLPGHFRENDRSSDYLASFYPKDILNSMNPDSYIFTSGDNQIYTLAYEKFVLKSHPDKMIFDNINTIFKDRAMLTKASGSQSPFANIVTAFSMKLSPLYTTVEIPSPHIGHKPNGLILELLESVPAGRDYSRNYLWKTYPLINILRRNRIFYAFEEREVAGFYFYRLAEYYESLGNDGLYAYLLDKAAEAAFDSMPVLTNLAIRMSYSDKIENHIGKAEELFNRAYALNPDNEQLLFNIGSFYGRLGLYDRAYMFFNRVIEINPLNINARNYLQRIVLEAETARQQAEEARKAAVQPASEHYNRGRELLNAKKANAAMEEFKKDAELFPDSDRSYFHIGLILSMQDKLEEAIPWYEKAVKNNPNNTSALNNLGLCYSRLYKRDEAVSVFEKSLAIDPGQPKIKELLDKLK
ncbi:MAG TPA: DUF2723 domain-containing protein [bacterium]|nr:DUF2723 domain-containing protein [bacterium]